MTVHTMILDTGVILPFSFYEWPTSKVKIIEFLLDKFDICLPEKILTEMGRPKQRLQDQWDEISITWDKIKGRVIWKNPPSSCLAYVLKQSGKQNLPSMPTDQIPAEYDVLALGLFLSHHHDSWILLATHEKNAFGFFNEFSRKEQTGHIFSPFDILLFAHRYLGITREDAGDVWKELIDFPNISINLPLRPVSYSSILENCFAQCRKHECL